MCPPEVWRWMSAIGHPLVEMIRTTLRHRPDGAMCPPIRNKMRFVTAEHGPWAPLAVDEVAALLGGAPLEWWISGGRALELHLGRSWREHDDTDLGIRRVDAATLHGTLAGWDLHVAAAGRLTEWDGRALDASRHENNVWCRRTPTGPWQLDVTVGDGDEREWGYRRDPRLRRPWREAVLRSAEGVPYLAPELQLLFKSKNRRPKDDVDAAEVLPYLDPARVAWLCDALPDGHPWRRWA